MITIQTTKGETLTVTTRAVGKKLVLASVFAPITGRTPIWQQDFPIATTDAEIEQAVREFLKADTSLLD